VKKDRLKALEPMKRARVLYKQQIRLEFGKNAPSSDEFYRRRANLAAIKFLDIPQLRL
jgi:hypothetical protein